MGMYASLSKGDLIEMNNKKLSRLLEPNLKLYFLCMIVFAAATATVSLPLGLVEIACTVGLYAYFTNRNQKRRQNILQYIDNVSPAAWIPPANPPSSTLRCPSWCSGRTPAR